MPDRETPEPEPTKSTKRGWVVGLGSTVGAGLLVAGVAFVPSLLGDDSQGATSRPTFSADTQSASPAPLPTVTATPTRLSALDTRVLFGVQSVGQDIIKGIPSAFSSARLTKPRVTSWTAAKKAKGPLVAAALIGRNGSPTSKLRAFATLVNDAPRGSANVALMAFNYQDITAETDVYKLYRNYEDTMESIEHANPDITFLYTTAPVASANSWRAVERSLVTGLGNADQPVWQDNIARERFNALIRERYSGSGRLFDIAALQAYVDSRKVTAKQHEEKWYYVMNPGLSLDGKKLNQRGSIRLAQNLMLLVEAVATR